MIKSDKYFTPGKCHCCGTEAPVFTFPHSPASRWLDGLFDGLCMACVNRLDEAMPNLYSDGSDSDGPSAWYPGVEADHPDWY